MMMIVYGIAGFSVLAVCLVIDPVAAVVSAVFAGAVIRLEMRHRMTPGKSQRAPASQTAAAVAGRAADFSAAA
jgi:hypothetical protein